MDATDEERRQRTAEAEELLRALRQVDLQHATRDTVAAYQNVLDLLVDEAGSPLWLEAQIGLGNHLQEARDEPLGERYRRAADAYRAVLALVTPDSPDAWEAAALGVADTLANQPSATHSELRSALDMYERLESWQRTSGRRTLVVTLMNHARLLSRGLLDDVDADGESAIRLLVEVTRILADPADADGRGRLARAWHNLGVGYLGRRPGVGVRSNNVDLAVGAFRQALLGRPADLDPFGRANTLRALAQAYPEWSGPGSRAEAEQLAAQAAAEAEALTSPSVRPRFDVQSESSALNVDLAGLQSLPQAERIQRLQAVASHHVEVLQSIQGDAMSAPMADWQGGLGRVLGLMTANGVDQKAAAYECFGRALAAINSNDHPRLFRDLCYRWGELAHQIADFERARLLFGRSADLSEHFLANVVDPELRVIELASVRGEALFAAYAEARMGHSEAALVRAEQQRGRSVAEVLDAAHAMRSASDEQRAAVVAVVLEIQQLEDQAHRLNVQTPVGELQRVTTTLADFIGIDPDLLNARVTSTGDRGVAGGDAARADAEASLLDARKRLRVLTSGVRDSGDAPAMSVDRLREVARQLMRPMVYLVTTMHGGAGLSVDPDGESDLLLLPELRSDEVVSILRGSEGYAGWLRVSAEGDAAAMAQALDMMRDRLSATLFEPLDGWLGKKGIRRAILVPLASLSLLPLHVASSGTVVFSYGPSARALGAAASQIGRSVHAGALIVANPTRAAERPLPFTVVELRFLAALIGESGPVTSLLEARAQLSAANDAAAANPAIVHFGCHGRFRPSDPLASSLLLAGDDQLTLADVFARHIDLSRARLISLLACESGLVEHRRAADEAIGFPAAFISAGVPGIVSTLWDVDDAAATLFSTHMYELIVARDTDPAEAVSMSRTWLQSATAETLAAIVQRLQSTLTPADEPARAAVSALWRRLALSGPDERPYRSAVYWAAFVFTGV